MKKSMMIILFGFLFMGLWDCRLNINNIFDDIQDALDEIKIPDLTVTLSVNRTNVTPSEEIILVGDGL